MNFLVVIEMKKQKIGKMLYDNFKVNMAAVFTLLVGGLIVGAGEEFAIFVAGGGLGTFFLYVMSMLDLNSLYRKVE